MATEVGSYITSSVDISKYPDEFKVEAELSIRMALRAMCDATLQRAQMLRDGNGVPYKSGALSSTGFVWTYAPSGFTYHVEFGNGLKYGRYQEFGPEGSDYKGNKTQWNYTTEGTGPHYLKTAGDSVAKEGIKQYL